MKITYLCGTHSCAYIYVFLCRYLVFNEQHTLSRQAGRHPLGGWLLRVCIIGVACEKAGFSPAASALSVCPPNGPPTWFVLLRCQLCHCCCTLVVVHMGWQPAFVLCPICVSGSCLFLYAIIFICYSLGIRCSCAFKILAPRGAAAWPNAASLLCQWSHAAVSIKLRSCLSRDGSPEQRWLCVAQPGFTA